MRRAERVAAEVNEEVRIHLEMKTNALMEAGLPREEARRRALEEFGDIEETARYCRRMTEESMRRNQRREILRDLDGDLRVALRRVRRAPGFSAVVILTLALGIGATTSVFSVLNGILLSPLPYPADDELFLVKTEHRGAGIEDYFVAPVDLLNAQAESRTLESVSGFLTGRATLVPDDGDPVQLRSLTVTHEFFTTLGLEPQLGRFFERDDSFATGGPASVVVSHDYWASALGGDPAVVGSSLRFRGSTATLIGVAPPTIDFAGGNDVYFAFGDLTRNVSYRDRFIETVARLNPGSTPAAVSEELARIGRETEPDRWDGWSVEVQSLRDAVVGDVRPVLWVLMASASLMLLIACANVANLLLSRASARGTEMSIRAALGSSRLRTLRLLMLEAVVLAAAGSVLGLALTWIALDSLISLGQEQLPRIGAIGVDGVVLGFAVLSTLVTALAFGLAPALELLRTDLVARLREGVRSSGAGPLRERLKNLLVGGQLTVSVVLVVAAMLLVKSFGNLTGADPGFERDGIVTMELSLFGPGYPSLDHAGRFYRELLPEIGALPGVDAVGAASSVPFGVQRDYPSPFLIVGRPPLKDGEIPPVAYYRQITPGFHEVMRTRIVSGRGFRESDDEAAHGVVVVNEAFVRHFFDGRDPVGERLADLQRPFGPLGETRRADAEIVGVMQDIHYGDMRTPTEAALYFPLEQAPFRRMSLVIDAAGDPQEVVASVRRLVRARDATLAPAYVSTVDVLVRRAFARDRFGALLVALFGGAAVTLAAIGVFGLVAFAVTRRAREFAIRVALGATPRSVVGMVLKRSLKLGGTGAALGLLLAVPLSRLLGSQLYGVSPNDPLVFGAVGALMLAVAVAAALIPAGRVVRSDSARTLGS